MPIPNDTPSPDVNFNILLAIEDPSVLLVGSPSLQKIFLFDYHLRKIDKKLQFPVEKTLSGKNPLKFLSLGDQKVLVVHKSHQESQIYFIKSTLDNQVLVFDLKAQSSITNGIVGSSVENLTAASHIDIKTNTNGPLIGILYNKNIIDVFTGPTYSLKTSLIVSEWSSSLESTEASLIFLPYSDFQVTAKYGETKVIFKNYKKEGLNDRVLETALSSIVQVLLSPEHKVITVFDGALSAII